MDGASCPGTQDKQAIHWHDKGLRHGTQSGVPMREELVTVYVAMRGYAGQVKYSACHVVA